MTPQAPVDFDVVNSALENEVSGSAKGEWSTGDRRDGRVFRADDNLRLAVRVALATERPLLLRGLPGTGKSSVASFVAERMSWCYHEMVMTSETVASDLLWRYDAVRRLADAQTAGARIMDSQSGMPELPTSRYLEPGPLWWGLSPMTAASLSQATEHNPHWDESIPENSGRDPRAAVVLIDEIDKADPNVPNALLVPLGSQSFVVGPNGQRISLEGSRTRTVLIVITTNGERDLPRAFIRRCIVHTMKLPAAPEMVKIAAVHDEAAGRPMSDADRRLCHTVADRVEEIQTEARKAGQRPPGTAEFLDAWRAARELEISPADADWAFVEQVTLRKEFTDLLEEGL